MAKPETLSDIVKKIMNDPPSEGYAEGKIPTPKDPDHPFYDAVGAFHLTLAEAKDYYNTQGMWFRDWNSSRGFGRPLFDSPGERKVGNDGQESLWCIPMGEAKKSRETVNLTRIREKKLLDLVPLGKEAVNVPYEAKLVTYQDSGRAVLRYEGTSAKSAGDGRDCFSINLNVFTSPQLAGEFMRQAETQPDEVWKTLTTILFPGVFEEEGSAAKGGLIPVMRKGEMYIVDLSAPKLQETGFKFGKPYLSMEDRLHRRIQHFAWASDPQHKAGKELADAIAKNPEAYKVFTELQKRGIGPEPGIPAIVVSNKRYVQYKAPQPVAT